MEASADFERLMKLAQLSLDKKEAESLRQDMERITAFAATVKEVAKAEKNTGEWICPLREDIPHNCLTREEVLRIAPATQEGFVSVPSVMEEANDA